MKMVKTMALSFGIMAAVSMLLLALAALIIDKNNTLPKELFPLIATIIGCIAVFLGSFIGSLVMREKGLLLGLISGGVFLLCVLIGSSFTMQLEFTLGSLGKTAAVFLSGSIGGILGVNRKGKVKF